MASAGAGAGPASAPPAVPGLARRRSLARSAPGTAGHAWPSLHGGARLSTRARRRPQGLSAADYERRKEEAADGILERLERHLPGLRAATLFREARRSGPGPPYTAVAGCHLSGLEAAMLLRGSCCCASCSAVSAHARRRVSCVTCPVAVPETCAVR